MFNSILQCIYLKILLMFLSNNMSIVLNITFFFIGLFFSIINMTNKKNNQ